MSRTYHHGERRVRVKGIRRDPPDMKRMSRALIELGKAQAETEAQAVDTDQPRNPKPDDVATSSATPKKRKSSTEDAA
jgi:hypothetical protein